MLAHSLPRQKLNDGITDNLRFRQCPVALMGVSKNLALHIIGHWKMQAYHISLHGLKDLSGLFPNGLKYL